MVRKAPPFSLPKNGGKHSHLATMFAVFFLVATAFATVFALPVKAHASGAPQNPAYMTIDEVKEFYKEGFSSATPAPGFYKVSANLGMFTPLGKIGYATNPLNPLGIDDLMGFPLTQVKHNAILEVDADGNMFLTVPLVNPVFTFNKLVGGSNTEVVAEKRGEIRIPTDDLWKKEIEAAMKEYGVTDCMTEVKIKLLDNSGIYRFAEKGNVEFPTILRMTLDYSPNLVVDLAHTAHYAIPGFVKTYTDEQSGISVDVCFEKDSKLEEAAKADKVTFGVKELKDAAEQGDLASAYERQFLEASEHHFYQPHLELDGKNLAGNESISSLTLHFPEKYKNGGVFTLTGTYFTPLKHKGYNFQIDELGTYLAVATEGMKDYPVPLEFVDPENPELTCTYYTDGEPDRSVYDNKQTAEQILKMYRDIKGGNIFQVNSREITDEETLGKVNQAINGSLEAAGMKIKDVYAFAIDSFSDAFGPYEYGKARSFFWPVGYYGEPFPVGNGHNFIYTQLPTDLKKGKVFIVSGTKGKLDQVRDANANLKNGQFRFDLIPKDTVASDSNTDGFWNAYRDTQIGKYHFVEVDGQRKPTYDYPMTDETKLAYIVVAEHKDVRITLNKSINVAKDLVYNGEEQVGVSKVDTVSSATANTPAIDYSEAVVIEGDFSAKDAGEHVATVTPNEGFAWENGTKEPKRVKWSIGKAELIATYVNETIKEGGKPALEVDVTGFLGEDTAKTAADYKAPAVTAPSQLEVDKSYELTPAGGTAKNYEFKYVPGVLKVIAQDVPNAAPDLTVEDARIVEGEKFDPMSMVLSATDLEDGDLKSKVTCTGAFDVNKPGTYELVFAVSDKDGAKTAKKATLTVEAKTAPEPKPVTDKIHVSDDVTVVAPEDIKLEVNKLSADRQAKVLASLKKDATAAVTAIARGKELIAAYDIDLLKNGKEIHRVEGKNGAREIKVEISNPKFTQYKDLAAVHILHKGGVVVVEPLEVKGDKISFTTDSFSDFLVFGVSKPKPKPKPEPTTTPSGSQGDVTNDAGNGASLLDGESRGLGGLPVAKQTAPFVRLIPKTGDVSVAVAAGVLALVGSALIVFAALLRRKA